MPFTEEQRRALKAKLRYRHVKTRANGGTPISYIEGWHVIAEANRIFGYDCWDRQTLSPRCLWRETQRGETTCFYTAKVRITVRAGEAVIVREGIGTGTGRGAAEIANETALKAAETDATKRALATFGNPFGLALYDKEQRGVTRRHHHSAESNGAMRSLTAVAEFELHHADRRTERFAGAEAFVAAALQAIKAQPSMQAVYAFWESNLTRFAALPRKGRDEDPMRVIGAAIKERVRILAHSERESTSSNGKADHSSGPSQHIVGKAAIDPPPGERVDTADPTGEILAAGQLAFPKEKRVRNKAHLAFVASQPCLVCGRRPAQAHHIRFAQPRALGLKVSDEFTVPLCNGHHDSVHNTGDERAWWARHGILAPLQIANRLWAASRDKTGEGTPTVANGEEPPW